MHSYKWLSVCVCVCFAVQHRLRWSSGPSRRSGKLMRSEPCGCDCNLASGCVFGEQLDWKPSLVGLDPPDRLDLLLDSPGLAWTDPARPEEHVHHALRPAVGVFRHIFLQLFWNKWGQFRRVLPDCNKPVWVDLEGKAVVYQLPAIFKSGRGNKISRLGYERQNQEVSFSSWYFQLFLESEENKKKESKNKYIRPFIFTTCWKRLSIIT